jgi:hypothetical protein
MSLDTLFLAVQRLSVLPPRSMLGASTTHAARVDADDYEERLAEIQRLRGAVYLEDGAISPSALDVNRRHITDFDYENWHIVVTSKSGQVAACIRLRLHDADIGIHQLKVYDLVERMPPGARAAFRSALESFLQEAGVERVRVGEVGGWAVSPDARRSPCTMALPIAAWSLYQIIGDAMVLSAATARHRSADILKGIGGFPLSHDGVHLAKFFDPGYRCDMEIVAYDSRRPLPKYAGLVDRIKTHLLGQVSGATHIPRGRSPFLVKVGPTIIAPPPTRRVTDGAGSSV